MIPIIGTVRLQEYADVLSQDVDGFASSADSPLAIVRSMYYSERWVERDGWAVLHRPTGWYLGRDWYSQEDAWRLMLACEPDFAAWQYATGDVEQSATIACHHHFKRAKEISGVR